MRFENLKQKTALVLGAGGFIGSHLVKRLKREGYYVRGVDLEHPEFSKTEADEFIIHDLRDKTAYPRLLVDEWEEPYYQERAFDEVYQLAADMGGAGYVFTGENDADIMYSSTQINLNVLDSLRYLDFAGKIFYSSSACIYPEELQKNFHNIGLEESDAYPANPDSNYGWEKLFSERLYLAYAKNYDLDICIARFHNIFGPEGTYQGGREKAPAAICRKVVNQKSGVIQESIIEVWGSGLQRRSFLYIDECIEGVRRLMKSDYKYPINIGSDRQISINDLTEMIINISGKQLEIKNIDGPVGVTGRNSDNMQISLSLGWKPSARLEDGMEVLYKWIENELIAK